VQCGIFNLGIHHRRELLNVFKEASYWERLGFDLPRQCWDVYRRRDDIRWLREELIVLTRNYNRAVTREKEIKLR
jgi:hypothetical protein